MKVQKLQWETEKAKEEAEGREGGMEGRGMLQDTPC